MTMFFTYPRPLNATTQIRFIAVMGNDELEKRTFAGNKSIAEILDNNMQPELEIFRSLPELFIESLQAKCVVNWRFNSESSSFLNFSIPITVGPKKCQASFTLPEKKDRNLDEIVTLLLDKVKQMERDSKTKVCLFFKNFFISQPKT